MKRTLLALAAVLWMLTGAACSSSPAPDEVVRAYMQALAAMDAEAMAAHTCPEIAREILDRSEQVAMAAESGMEISVGGLEYEVVAKEESSAIVRVRGTARFAGMDEPVDEDLRLVMIEGQWLLCEEYK